MPRMRILSTAEQEQFETAPSFDSQQQKKFLNFSKSLVETAQTFRKPAHKIGFLLSCGYFNAAKRFFSPKDYQQRDIDYVAGRLSVQPESFDVTSYANRTRQRHEHIILEFYGFKRFDQKTESLICKEINSMVQDQLKPKLIFGRCLDLLIQNRVQLPNARRIVDLIQAGINQRKLELARLIEQNLSVDTRELLDSLFVQEATNQADGSPSVNSRYKLTLLKKFSQSTKPTKVKQRVVDVKLLEDLHVRLRHVLDVIDLSHEGIRYYAVSVQKTEIFQLTRRSDEDRYVHVIAFIAHQYHRLQDNLVDVLLSVVKSFRNSSQREHKEQTYAERKMHRRKLTSLLAKLDDDVFSVLRDIRKFSFDNMLSDGEKIDKIRSLLGSGMDDELVDLKAGLEDELDEENYYSILEARSVRLQNRVAPILKALNFEADPGASALMEAIRHFKIKDGAITQSAPIGFLDVQERNALINPKNQKIRTSLYKSFLFLHTANAIKSGNLNLTHSCKYRPLDEYMINKSRWNREKDQLLNRAGLADFADPQKVLHSLDEELYRQYQRTNTRAIEGENPHLKPMANGHFRIVTPALDDKVSASLQQFFPKRHYVPLTEVLSTVNRHCGYLDELQHWQQRHIRKTVSSRTLYAGLMGLGCGIGTAKMGRISTKVGENELEHAVNWYFSLDNIQAANDRIVRHMSMMELPNVYRRSQNILHTASDGQKFEIRTESLNANYSFKYFGKGQGVSAYTFIDERNLLWHSLVFSAAERESAYVIDGLMRNDVVKSDIHSTDTHGYSEAIFAATHLLGFSYAPRIKNLKKQSLYIFKSRKNIDQSGWSITPDKYINERVIEDNWDDFIRLIATIKLKETTASDIFRRMNSYSKQHTLYKAMKAFGQIIKSLFILRYLDEVELRQAIEKQLNKVELANRFTRAIAVGNPREFTEAEKEKQEIGESCNRLIKNCVICWNYLYLSQKQSQAENQEYKDLLLEAIIAHSVVSWPHINLLGEYDFSDEKLQDSVGIQPPKLAA